MGIEGQKTRVEKKRKDGVGRGTVCKRKEYG